MIHFKTINDQHICESQYPKASVQCNSANRETPDSDSLKFVSTLISKDKPDDTYHQEI